MHTQHRPSPPPFLLLKDIGAISSSPSPLNPPNHETKAMSRAMDRHRSTHTKKRERKKEKEEEKEKKKKSPDDRVLKQRLYNKKVF